jgi:hypothetical protein
MRKLGRVFEICSDEIDLACPPEPHHASSEAGANVEVAR